MCNFDLICEFEGVWMCMYRGVDVLVLEHVYQPNIVSSLTPLIFENYKILFIKRHKYYLRLLINNILNYQKLGVLQLVSELKIFAVKMIYKVKNK